MSLTGQDMMETMAVLLMAVFTLGDPELSSRDSLWACGDDLAIRAEQSSRDEIRVVLEAVGDEVVYVNFDELPFHAQSNTDFFLVDRQAAWIRPRGSFAVGHSFDVLMLNPGERHEYTLDAAYLFDSISEFPQGALFWRWRYQRYLNGKYRCDVFGRFELEAR